MLRFLELTMASVFLAVACTCFIIILVKVANVIEEFLDNKEIMKDVEEGFNFD